MRYLTGVVLLFSSLLAAQVSPSSALKDLVLAAERAEEKGDLNHAIQLYGEMLRIRPHWISAEFHLALAYDSQQRYPEAIALLTETIRHNPAMADAYLLRGKDYYEINQYRDALQSLKTALALQPKNGKIQFYLGATYYQLADYGRAADAYLKQIRIEPQESDNYFQLVQSYQALQNAALQRIDQNPQAAYFALLLEAQKVMDHQDFAIAESQIRAAISVSPNAAEAWALLSQLNSRRGEQAAATLNFQKAMQREAKVHALFHGLVLNQAKPAATCQSLDLLASAYCNAAHDDFVSSTELAKKAGATAKSDPRTWYWLSQIYGRLTQKAMAKLAQLAPNSPGLHKLYARAFSDSGHTVDAEREYETAIAADDQDASTFIEYANLKFKQQEFPRAIELLQSALRLTPYDVNLYGLLAQAYVHNNEPALAAPYFSQVLKTNPANEQTRIDLAECFHNIQRTPEAIALLEAAPTDPDGRVAYVLARYYARQGDKDKAASSMEIFRRKQQLTSQ